MEIVRCHSIAGPLVETAADEKGDQECIMGGRAMVGLAIHRMSAFRPEILVGHQRRHRHAPEHFMGDAAKNPFLQTRMSVAAHHQ